MNEWNNLYGSKKWKLYREAMLYEHPYCQLCFGTQELHIDHIFDHKGDLDLFYEYRNLQVLCREHHASKTTLDTEVAKLPVGEWVLNLVIEPNSSFTDYIDVCGYNQWNVYKRIINETKINPYYIDLSLDWLWTYGDKKYLMYLLIKKMKSKPKKILYNETFFPDWFIKCISKLVGGS